MARKANNAAGSIGMLHYLGFRLWTIGIVIAQVTAAAISKPTPVGAFLGLGNVRQFLIWQFR